MKMNDLQLITVPQGALIEERNCLTTNYFDIAMLKAERAKVETRSYDNSVLLWLLQRDYVLLKSLLSFAY